MTIARKTVTRSAATGTLLLSLVLGPATARAQTPVAPTPAAPAAERSLPPAPPVGGTPAPMAVPPPPPAPPPPPPAYAPPTPATTGESPLAPVPPPPTTSKVPSYILWGVAGASLLVGAGFGLAAMAGKTDFDDNPTGPRADHVHNMAVLSDVGIGLGAILAITGTVFFFADRPEGTAIQAFNHAAKRTQRHGAPVAQLQMVPLVSPSAGGGAVSFQF